MSKRPLRGNSCVAMGCALVMAMTACSNDSKKTNAASDTIEGNVEIEVIDETNSEGSEFDYQDNESYGGQYDSYNGQYDSHDDYSSHSDDDDGDNYDEFLIN